MTRRTPPSGRSWPRSPRSTGIATRGATFRAWLFRIAHNQLANALRRASATAAASLDLVDEPIAHADPAGVLSRAEEARGSAPALERLPDDRRQVVVLRFVDGLSAREIGAVLGRSEGAVRVLQHRALRELAEIR